MKVADYLSVLFLAPNMDSVMGTCSQGPPASKNEAKGGRSQSLIRAVRCPSVSCRNHITASDSHSKPENPWRCTKIS